MSDSTTGAPVPDRADKPSKRSASYLSPPDIHCLDWACVPVERSFCGGEHIAGLYLVGSVLTRPDFRDLDLRLIQQDDRHEQMFSCPAEQKLIEVAISKLIESAAGLRWPIDFQFQSMTEANVPEHGMRNPMGVGRGYRV